MNELGFCGLFSNLSLNSKKDMEFVSNGLLEGI